MENHKHKKSLVKKPFLILTMIMIIGVASFLIYEAGFSLEVNFNGAIVGYAKNNEEVDKALEFIEKDVLKTFGEDAYFEKEIVTDKVRGHKNDIIEADDLSKTMAAVIEVYKPASVIMIDNEPSVVVASESVANEILSVLKKPFEKVKDESKVLDVYFLQEVEVVNMDALVDDILSYDEALLPFRIKAAKPHDTVAQNKESVIEVSNLINSASEDLIKLSYEKDKNQDDFKTMKLEIEGFNLDVVSVLEEKVLEDIEHKTIKENDSSLYKGDSKVKQKGVDGEREITSLVTYVNGKETKVEEVKKEVITEPVDKIILVGTKQRVYSQPRYNSYSASRVVNEAWVQVNNRAPYVFGGSSPSGFDCSGLTSYVFGQTGVYLPHSSTAQASMGTAVSRGNLRPGDLVFFRGQSGAGIGHVGIYIGNGQMIHASVPGTTISVTSINLQYFSSRYVTARRI